MWTSSIWTWATDIMLLRHSPFPPRHATQGCQPASRATMLGVHPPCETMFAAPANLPSEPALTDVALNPWFQTPKSSMTRGRTAVRPLDSWTSSIWAQRRARGRKNQRGGEARISRGTPRSPARICQPGPRCQWTLRPKPPSSV